MNLVLKWAVLMIMLSAGLSFGKSDVSALAGDERMYFISRMEANLKAWSYREGDARFDEAGPDYSTRPDVVFWDPIPPVEGYRGWDAYKSAVPVWIKNGIVEGNFSLSDADRFRAWQSKDIAWNVLYCDVKMRLANNQEIGQACRGTVIWAREHGSWKIVHEAFSVPSDIERPGFFIEPHEDKRIKPNERFARRVKNLMLMWSSGGTDRLAERVAPLYADDATVITPWGPKHAYEGFDAFSEGMKRNVAPFISRMTIEPAHNLETHQRGRLAWSTSNVTCTVVPGDGQPKVFVGRQTLIWRLTAGGWRVVHHHLSFPVGGS